MTFWFPSKIVWMLRIPRPADLSTPSRLLSASHSVNSKYCQQRVLTFPPRNTHGPWPWLFGFCSLKMTSNVPFKTMSCRLCGAGHQCPPTATRKKVLTWEGGGLKQWLVNPLTTDASNSSSNFGGFGKGKGVACASCLWSLPSPL